MFAIILKRVFTIMTRRKIVDDVVQGIIVGDVLGFVMVTLLINNSQNVT